MKRRFPMLLAAGALISQQSFANMELAKSKNCMACHALVNKVVGPAYKDVAAKYSGDLGAEERLTAKVLKGGSGVWGPIPMPANPQVTETEARTLVKWILGMR